MTDETPPTSHEPARKDGRSSAAFLPIGIAFLGVGIAFLANEDMRVSAWAFLPLGFVFLILSMNGGAAAPNTGEEGESAETSTEDGRDQTGEQRQEGERSRDGEKDDDDRGGRSERE